MTSIDGPSNMSLYLQITICFREGRRKNSRSKKKEEEDKNVLFIAHPALETFCENAQR